jgi:hypothetical protein
MDKAGERPFTIIKANYRKMGNSDYFNSRKMNLAKILVPKS